MAQLCKNFRIVAASASNELRPTLQIRTTGQLRGEVADNANAPISEV
jgi:hypothetical protein